MGSEKWLSAKPSTHLWSSCKPTSISGWRITTTTGHIQGIYCFGNTLMQTFLDSRQLAWDKIGSGGIGHSGRCLTIFFVRSSSDYYTLSGRMSSQNALVVFHAKEAFHFHFFVPLLLRAFLRSCC